MSNSLDRICTVDISLASPISNDANFDNILILGPAPANPTEDMPAVGVYNSLEELTALPGVGRKTANVIRGNIFHEPSVVVDTHVKRISKKLGLTKEDDPEKVEYELMKVLPKDHWILYNIQIITLGRTICKAPTPKCGECFLTEWCKDYQNRQKKESRKKK